MDWYAQDRTKEVAIPVKVSQLRQKLGLKAIFWAGDVTANPTQKAGFAVSALWRG